MMIRRRWSFRFLSNRARMNRNLSPKSTARSGNWRVSSAKG
jgi:hypothetical protein